MAVKGVSGPRDCAIPVNVVTSIYLFLLRICNTLKCTNSNSHCNKHFQLKLINRNMSCKLKVVVHFLLILYNQLYDTKILFGKDKIKKKKLCDMFVR